MAGYSGTPLAKKLSLKPGLRAWFDSMPAEVAARLADCGVELLPAPEAGIDAAHIFVTGYADMEGIASDLPRLTKPFRQAELEASIAALAPAGSL